LFPVGDRRSVPVIRAQAELIGHETTATDDPRLIPDGIDRRANPGAPSERPAMRRRLFPRILGAIFNTHS
jgi:hypothetical protein